LRALKSITAWNFEERKIQGQGERHWNHSFQTRLVNYQMQKLVFRISCSEFRRGHRFYDILAKISPL
jgi:hypothetical protein